MKELKLYLVKFNKDGIIKNKIYQLDYTIRGEDCWPIIIITYNECTFLENNGICKAWTRIRNTFLHFKG